LRDFVEDVGRPEPALDASVVPDPTDDVGPDAPILAAVEIHGAHAQALLGRLGYQALASHFIVREGLGSLGGAGGFDPEAWYPALPFVRAAHALVGELGPRASFDATRFADDRPPSGDPTAALRALDRTYHRAFRLRGAPLVDADGAARPGIGRYLVTEPGPCAAEVTATGPWPCDFDRDLIAGVALRHAPDAVVEHTATEPCRRRGAGGCRYRVRWGRSLAALRPAATLDELAADRHGRYLAGPSFVFLHPDPQLDVSIFRGRPMPADLEELIRFWDAIRDESERHAALIDLRCVVEIPPETFAVIDAVLRARRGRRIRALAVVRPPTMAGAVVTGALQMSPLLHPVQFFDELGAALAWLGRTEPALVEALERLGG
jgi:hypothetical protein